MKKALGSSLVLHGLLMGSWAFWNSAPVRYDFIPVVVELTQTEIPRFSQQSRKQMSQSVSSKFRNDSISERKEGANQPSLGPKSPSKIETGNRALNQELSLNISSDGNTEGRYPSLEYPLLARIRHWDGKVIIEFITNSNGRVNSFILVQSTGHEVLDQAAVNAVRGWVLQRNTKYRVLIRFELR